MLTSHETKQLTFIAFDTNKQMNQETRVRSVASNSDACTRYMMSEYNTKNNYRVTRTDVSIDLLI